MPPIGDALRDARLRQRLDIAEVEQATKIRGKYLRALESEEFERLPGSTFVRTFLRTYAEYLGLDSQLLLDEYRQRHESPAEDLRPLTPPPSSRPVARERRRMQLAGPSRGAMIVAAVVALLALLLVIGLLTGEEEGGGTGEPQPAARGTQERSGGGAGGRDKPEEEKEDEATLRVSPLGETYVCVENGEGEEIFEQTIAEPETFKAQTLRVNLGNTQVEIELNGEEVPIEQGANPVAYEFTPEGEEELPESERPCT